MAVLAGASHLPESQGGCREWRRQELVAGCMHIPEEGVEVNPGGVETLGRDDWLLGCCTA